jgi:hypothetical protein
MNVTVTARIAMFRGISPRWREPAELVVVVGAIEGAERVVDIGDLLTVAQINARTTGEISNTDPELLDCEDGGGAVEI